MGALDDRPAERPAGKSKKGIFLVIAAPIALILFWILFVTVLPRFLN